MNIALVGLGAMGSGMAGRLVDAGLRVDGFDSDAEARARARGRGASVHETLEQTLAASPGPRVVWLMLPAGVVTRSVTATVLDAVGHGDIVVDGGNSHFADAAGHSERAVGRGAAFADVGVSGGQWGAEHGYGLMVGADEDTYRALTPVLDALSADGGHRRVGGPGSGHLVKALHNGVQYGILQAYAEGFALLRAHPEVDAAAALGAWQAGSSVRSWLLEQIIAAVEADPGLDDVEPVVPDSGMGRWTSEEAIRLGVPTPVIAAALHARFRSRSDGSAERMLRAARTRIGGQR
ncbi:NADP-dependent phosphogluconate dehydrogenase [Glycomyces harbinensis]|uniref:6-phosphogluconate dehydrogenase n=1 Tax=Glycomyces harbinensis TaxID=58114 RepID=A0A1G6UAK9_9ACTN|nr:NADP-dependent phosphogluconate dehydrogenase [Glycomyces harbinensis]SDD38319.1 6-phosphogluconate dehydrogenase [Glycomyces harbinensis]